MKIPKFHDAHRGSRGAECQIRQTQAVWGNPREVGSRRGRLTLVSFAVGTDFVRLEFQQVLDGLLILGGLARSRASRHNPWESRWEGERRNNGDSRNAQVAVGPFAA